MKREEAIKEMREKLPWLTEDTKRLVEALIPELAESEDERIRKWLIAELKDDYFTDYTPDESKAKAEKAIAYLEKQKDLPMPNSTELIEMWDAEKTKLKEKDFRDDAWRLAYNAFMDGFANGTCVKFEKQNEQKPAEWSEEDKRFVRDAIAAVEAFYSEGCGQEELVNWLKSLRPHWKPSEEQMEALKCTLADIARFSKRGGRQVELENEPYYSALHSLYCNLEKLI